MKTFLVTLSQVIRVEVNDDRATEKTAAYLAETVGVCHHKSGYSKNLTGGYSLTVEPGARVENVREVDSKKKSR